MKTAHNIKVRVFAKENEDVDRIKERLVSLFPFDLEKEKVVVNSKKATGFNEKVIYVLDVELQKDRYINAFIENLFSRLDSEQKKMLLRQLNSRVDDDCNFFMRLDKEKLLSGKYWITDSGDCYHIKISVAAFPSKKEKAVELVRHLLS